MPSLRCPVCRAQVEVGPNCRRCKADLSLLLQLEQQRTELLAQASTCLHTNQLDLAFAYAMQAKDIRDDEANQKLLAVIHLARREFPQAWQMMQIVKREQTSV